LSWDFDLKTFSGVNLEYKKSKFMYKKGDYKKLSEFLNTPDWENMFRDKDVPQIIREAKSLNCFEAGLDGMGLFKIFTFIYKKKV
jgi:hypothetical protein